MAAGDGSDHRFSRRGRGWAHGGRYRASTLSAKLHGRPERGRRTGLHETFDALLQLLCSIARAWRSTAPIAPATSWTTRPSARAASTASGLSPMVSGTPRPPVL